MTHDNTESDFAKFVKKNAKKPVPYYVAGILFEAIKALQGTVKELRQQVSELETKSMKYAGVWESGKTYGAGSVVTRSGSSWHTTRATCGTPGGPLDMDRDWVLMVKRGRDGRDARS